MSHKKPIIYRVVDKTITLVIDEDEAGATGVRINLTDTDHMTELVDILPVLDEEVVDPTVLSTQNPPEIQIVIIWVVG